jgi:hypothetical protein
MTDHSAPCYRLVSRAGLVGSQPFAPNLSSLAGTRERQRVRTANSAHNHPPLPGREVEESDDCVPLSISSLLNLLRFR